jgi:hypothetical protein
VETNVKKFPLSVRLVFRDVVVLTGNEIPAQENDVPKSGKLINAIVQGFAISIVALTKNP